MSAFCVCVRALVRVCACIRVVILSVTSPFCCVCVSGLVAKKAVEAGLTVSPYIKTSLSPGSGVVTYYLKESGVITPLEKLG